MIGLIECKKELQELLDNVDDWVKEKDWLLLEMALRQSAQRLQNFQFAVAAAKRRR